MTEQIKHVYPHILAAITSRPWAIHEATMGTILEIMEMRADGYRYSAEEIDKRLAAARVSHGPRQGASKGKNVAVIPIYGVITPRASGMMASGANSVMDIRENFRAALDDDDIDAIVFDVDSPGGVVDGLPEMWQEIYDARGEKPMTAIANTQMASGAFWLASAADRVVASPSATVGSVGVIGIHTDKSEQFAKEGVKHTIIKTSPYKGEGHPSEPLSEDAQQAMLAEAQEYDDMFVGHLASARGVAPETVRAAYGQGRVLTAARALNAGMIDAIETFDRAVANAPSAGNAHALAALDDGPTWAITSVGDTDLAGSTSDVVHLIPQTMAPATEPPFAERLRLVTAEAEALAAIARERLVRRADGRPLSGPTTEHLSRLNTALAELVTVPTEEDPQARVASIDYLDLMKHQYLEGIR